MPEEINRVVTDNLSDLLFVTEKIGVTNLVNEGVSGKKVHLAGDTMIDSLILFKDKFGRSGILNKLHILKQQYVLVTIHRPANTDKKDNLSKIISILMKISSMVPEFKIVFPLHPRTGKMLKHHGLEQKLKRVKNLLQTHPAGYTDFIKMLTECKFVITDSGGIQEEATFLRVPCLTLRDSFERPETIELGSNSLCGLNENLILKKVNEILSGKYKKGKIPKLMDGKASERIVKVLLKKLI